MSLCCYVAALVVGVGGFEALASTEGGAATTAATETSAGALRLAYPQRAPRDFLPQPEPLEELTLPDTLRSTIARQQQALSARTAAARSAPAPVRARPLELSTRPDFTPGTRVEVTLSYYYCTAGPSGRRVGDGGGFCGTMRNGVRVHSGATACAHRYLGQRFRIIGDPTARTYTCEDTGSAVHGLHRDVWFQTADAGRSWLRAVGQRAVIEIVP